MPLIRRAEMVRNFPNHVRLIVEERRPFTVVNTGRLHWIDEEGVDLGVESRAVALGVPLLSGLGPRIWAPEATGPRANVSASACRS